MDSANERPQSDSPPSGSPPVPHPVDPYAAARAQVQANTQSQLHYYQAKKLGKAEAKLSKEASKEYEKAAKKSAKSYYPYAAPYCAAPSTQSRDVDGGMQQQCVSPMDAYHQQLAAAKIQRKQMKLEVKASKHIMERSEKLNKKASKQAAKIDKASMYQQYQARYAASPPVFQPPTSHT
mmetsp:Transcript_7766/g.19600  ORF Transcript_7766/g.19600 Transcript_7766/m.19600 type:complete len:179 (-) Transcript_7766:103-639(-)|eukprot:CAMPEP_0177652454 /NCGR_PEP_ID=MMETSP0447-20121125/13142_1 /TAXON_ID=0 /ORGANISM="Stygamoeba regulata, Strain BSH-02190019" /LENGTH=178 /DNA_ID=CAMNT_0019155707 /DNA_START=58 /DNA_END=594 /DNA_ORIENTATION=+